MPRDPRVLYIAGYSRSGSTILDMLLGSHPSIVSTGELTFLLDDAQDARRQCTCSAPYLDCPRYGPWLRSQPGQLALKSRKIIRAVEARRPARGLDRNSLYARVSYASHAESLYRHIARSSGAEIVLDSSKSARDAARRPLALAQIGGLDVRVIHLTRDPRAVVRSYCQNGRNWVAEGHRTARHFDSFRPILGWRNANQAARALEHVLEPTNYLHLRFEDLLKDPKGQLTRIGNFVGLDIVSLAKKIDVCQPLTAEHNVGGNRARFTSQTLLPSRSKTPKLPLLHEFAFRLMANTSARTFGYS